jgi:hypothetical protein
MTHAQTQIRHASLPEAAAAAAVARLPAVSRIIRFITDDDVMIYNHYCYHNFTTKKKK